MIREARVANTSATRIEAYLPSNYTVEQDGDDAIIRGEDVAGWTLDDYVIPRLASGLIFAKETTNGLFPLGGCTYRAGPTSGRHQV